MVPIGDNLMTTRMYWYQMIGFEDQMSVVKEFLEFLDTILGAIS